jgi:hypothetical protein
MRGRILIATVMILGAAALVAACSRRDQLYIDPGKAEASPAKKDAPPPKPAAPGQKQP